MKRLITQVLVNQVEYAAEGVEWISSRAVVE